MRRTLTAACAVFLLLGSLPALAAGEAPPLPTQAFLTDHLQPRHATFHRSTEDMREAAARFCEAPQTGDLTSVSAAYHAAMDAWGALQHVTYGPIGNFNRRFRIQFWPDPRNVLDRDLAGLLRDRPEDVLKEHGLTFASVAVQGFPAVERLIHGDGAAALATGTEDAAYRCRLLVAVARNVERIAADLTTEWQADDGWPAAFRDPAGSGMVGDAGEVASLVLTGLTTQLQALRDQRLLPVLGPALAEAAPGKAEGGLSGRSLRGIAASLEAEAEAFDTLLLPPLTQADPKLAGLMQRAFAQTLATARGIPVPLDVAVADPDHRPAVETLAKEIRALQQLLATRVATALGLTLGFNSLDGD